jgi:PAS domain S-box-containing protein
MNSPDIYYALFLFLSFLSCLAVVLFVWQRREKRGAWPIIGFMLAMAQWSLTYAIHWLVVDPQQRWFWLNMTYFGAATVPVAFFLFALVYTHRDHWLTPRVIALLLVQPALVLLLLWTDQWHGFFFGGKRAPEASVFLDGGPGFWLNIGYSYLLILIGFVMLLQMYAQVRAPYRKQLRIILLGALLPWLGSLLSLAGVRPPGLDLTPLVFVLSGIIFTVGLFRAQLLDLIPVAHSQLIATMADGLLVLDTADRIVDVNPSAARLFGRRQEELIGRPTDDLFNHWPAELAPLRHLNEGRQEVLLSVNPRLYFDIQVTPLYDKGRQLTGRLITWHDISERKLAELERERLVQELDAYAHTVAHDLKNPLALIIGYSEILLETEEASTTNRQTLFLSLIHKNSHRMLRIVDELLLLATIRDQSHVPLEPISMGEWVESALERLTMLRAELEGKISLPQEWPLAIGYGPWVEEVWVNYLSNALKYGGRPPQVTLGTDTLKNGLLRFWVQDNGAGLSPEAQARLFEEFERLNQAQGHGYGLGLSVVRRIVERLGGEVGVESTVGRGSLFYFTLPAIDPAFPGEAASHETNRVED